MHRGGTLGVPAEGGHSGFAQASLAKLRGALSVRSSSAPLVALGGGALLLLAIFAALIDAGKSPTGALRILPAGSGTLLPAPAVSENALVGSSEQGTSTKGSSAESSSEQVASTQGSSGESPSEQGTSTQGSSGESSSEQGTSTQGSSGESSPEQGTSTPGSSGESSSEQGTSTPGSSGELASAVSGAAEGQTRAAEPGDSAGEGPDPSRPSKCSEACFVHGSCNEETGECACLPSYEGADCERDALPACELAPGYRTPCTALSTCECIVQCQRLLLPIHWPHCLLADDAQGQRITNLSQLYDSPLQILPWANGGTEFLAPFPEPDPEKRSYLVDPALCKDKCSGRGVCTRDQHGCLCSWATGGYACEESPAGMTVPCYNSCSGRGTCVLGACQCQRGFFGLDCSLFVDRSGKTRVLQRPPYNWAPSVPWPPLTGAELRPRVYVYELPPHFNAWQGAHSHMHLDFPEQVWLLERMLNTPHRTADPEEADVFYLPLILRNRKNNEASTLEAAMAYVQMRWPYYNRSGGADHFFMTNNDWGNCQLGGKSPEGEFSGPATTMSTITLWGCTTNMHMEAQNPCFRPGRDIKVPMGQPEMSYHHAPLFTGKVVSPQERSILLYFRGASYSWVTKPWGRGWFTHSFGVRQEVFRLYEGRFNETGILLDRMEGVSPDWHLQQFLKSKFCLIAAGYGMGPRGPQAVFMGCIPVIIQPHTDQAFQGDVLDWKEFSVMLNKEDIPRLEQILRAIPEEELERKRNALARVQMHFIWSSTNRNPIPQLPPEDQARHAAALLQSDVFETIMQVMRTRLQKAGKL